MRKLVDMIRFYLNDEGGFLGIGEDKVTTTTTGLSEADRQATERGRVAGRGAADMARNSDPWALGPGQGLYDAKRQYGQMYGGYGDAAGMYGDMAQRAGNLGMQGGFNQGNHYARQIMDQWDQGMLPQHQENLAMGTMAAGQNAFLQGAGGGSRQAVAEAMNQRGINQDFMAQRGQMYGNAMQQGNQYAQMDKARQAQIFGQAQQGQFAGMQGQGNMAGAGANMQGQITGALERQNADAFNRERTAAATELGSFGRIMEQSSEQRQKGNFFGDMLSLGGMVSGFIPGGSGSTPNAGAPGGGGYGTPSIQNSPIMQGGGLMGGYGQGAPNLGMGGWGGQQQWGGWGASGNAAFPMMYGG